MKNGIEYLNSLGLHKVKPGLERIKTILMSLDDPQDKVPGIIVAGTNGKGSVAATISSILSAQGYKVGLYTSPHLINITERIKINDVQIPETKLSSIIIEIKEAAENSLNEVPSYFEVITAAAFVYFAREKIDFNVLEVGMGGRWDATNVIAPLVSVITNISLEHTEFLGETVEEIAAEKACVIKPKVPIVSGVTDKAFEVIAKTASNNSSELILHNRDFKTIGENTDDFEYEGISLKLKNLNSNLKGKYQLVNLSIAIAAIESLRKSNSIKTDEKSIREGLSNIDWQGRFEIIKETPPVILDSAHNPGAAKSLVESIKDLYPDTNFTFLIGMLDDKGHEEFLETISPITDELIITNVPSERTADLNKLLEIAKKSAEKVKVIEDYRAAYKTLLKSNEPICIAGSLYLTGAIKNLIGKP